MVSNSMIRGVMQRVCAASLALYCWQGTALSSLAYDNPLPLYGSSLRRSAPLSIAHQALTNSNSVSFVNNTTSVSSSQIVDMARKTLGSAGENFMDGYFKGQGWKSIPRLRSQGIDHLLYRRSGKGIKVIIVETKTGTSQLHDTTKRGYQMSQEWILKDLNERLTEYGKKLRYATSAKEQGELRQTITTLKKIEKVVKSGNYRRILARVSTKSGMLTIEFHTLKEIGGRIVKDSLVPTRFRTIDLKNVSGLTKASATLVEQYYRALEQSLGKTLGDLDQAKRVIRSLKTAYQHIDNIDTYVFIKNNLRQIYSRTAQNNAGRSLLRVAENLPRYVSQVRMGRVITQSAAQAKSFMKSMGKYAGPTLLVVDVGANVYLQYCDHLRWRSGEISGRYYAFKTGLRATQSGLMAYSVLSPDPTLATKVTTFMVAVGLIVVDIASDPFVEWSNEQYRRQLESIDNQACFEACRLILTNMAGNL